MKTSSLFAIATLCAPFAVTYADPFPRIDIAAPATPITFQVTTGGFSPNLIEPVGF